MSNEEKKRFKVGDKVEWSSQAAGSTSTKVGTIVAIVEKGEAPGPAGLKAADDIAKREGESPAWLKCRKQFDGLWGRNHESYLVHVPTKSGKGKGKIYWPRVSHLRSA